MINLRFSKYIISFLCLGLTTLVFLTIFFCLATKKKRQTNHKVIAEEHDNVRLPIIMYHGLTKKKSRENKFVINVKFFNSDIEYLKKNGYNTVVVEDLINFVYEKKDLPENPIMLTFDDGYFNNYFYANEILKKNGYKIVFSPIGKFVDVYSEIEDENLDYSCVSWNRIKEMIESNTIELQNHSYDLHTNTKRHGCKKMKSESLENYSNTLKKDLTKFQKKVKDHNLPSPTTFVYPFGAICNEGEKIVKELGFKCSFACEGKINPIAKGDFECLYHLGRFIRIGDISSENFFKRILNLI